MQSAVKSDATRFIPPGIFYAGADDSRAAAIQWMYQLGSKLADRYRSEPPTACIVFAAEYLPDIFESYPQVATKAVENAVGRLIGPDERRKLRRRRLQLMALVDHASDAFREHCRKAAKKRYEVAGVDVSAMLAGRGRTAWSEAEKMRLRVLSVDPAHRHPSSDHPNWKEIAETLNSEFHEGNQIRYANSAMSMVT